MIIEILSRYARSSRTHSTRRPPAGIRGWVLILALVGGNAHAVTQNDLRQYEEDWTKAQQQYYDELKKLKSPRRPEQVQSLKDSILTPKKKALQDAYRKFEEPKSRPTGNVPDTEADSPESGTANARSPEPTVILDGSGVKKEVRYLKKGAPVDMTEEESPEFEGPTVLASPGTESAGEIAYPVRKKKTEAAKPQGLKNKAP